MTPYDILFDLHLNRLTREAAWLGLAELGDPTPDATIAAFAARQARQLADPDHSVIGRLLAELDA